jgi:hypothetical protein
MSDDQTASAGSEPACRPGSTPGRGTGETLSVCFQTPQSPPAYARPEPARVATSSERRRLSASARVFDGDDRASEPGAVIRE